jgi:hypothetical protein
MKTKIISALAVGLLFVFFAGISFAQDAVAPDVELKVAGFEGKVQVKTSPSTEWADATVGQALNPKDSIKTGDDGQTMLQFSDKSTVAMKPNTEITVEDLVWSDASRKASLNMSIGDIRVMLKKVSGPSDFKVKTPTAICGARGTIFYVMVTATQTRVFVTESSVDFTIPASGNTYVVIENMAAISGVDGTVTEPRELTGAERDEALAGWSGVIGETYTEPPAGGDDAGGDAGGDDGLNSTPENPAVENKGQQESDASPI